MLSNLIVNKAFPLCLNNYAGTATSHISHPSHHSKNTNRVLTALRSRPCQLTCTSRPRIKIRMVSNLAHRNSLHAFTYNRLAVKLRPWQYLSKPRRLCWTRQQRTRRTRRQQRTRCCVEQNSRPKKERQRLCQVSTSFDD